MRKYLLVLFAAIFSTTSFSQDFSNKGKDFWVGYGYHQQMTNGGGGGSQTMVLYFATDQVTNITVSIPGTGYTQTLTSGAVPTVLTSAPIPKTGAQDATLRTESLGPENKGIHIVSDKPIVAYAHIYNSNVSGATILFPTNTLGKEYYSVNYENISNTDNANCWFYVVACDTGTTTVEITPSANTINHGANVTFTVNLTQGQIYNVMGELTGQTGTPPNLTFNGVDLTGSKIKSIASATGACKRIAVFSGSGRIGISCSPNSASSDNYMVQAFPKTAWGKKYLTCHTGGAMTANIYRICVSDPATVVTVNGAPIAYPLINNFYYELPVSDVQQKIESDLPILVSQYITSQNNCGNGSPGDPEVIYLSPVEQNIAKVTWNATGNFNITQHFFNVVVPNTGTGVSTFQLKNAAGAVLPIGAFTPHPQDPNYSYLIEQLPGPGVYTIESDSGFNAIAYGFGQAESYGYNAGTNIRDLYNFLTPINPYSISIDPVACTGTPFYYSVTFPFQPSTLFWDFHGYPLSSPIPNVTVANPLTILDATYFIGTRQVWRYKLPGTSMYTPAGTYPVTITAGTTTSEGCGNSFERDFDLNVYDPPVADFYWQNNGCVTDTVRFRDTTNYAPGTYSYKWYWNFGDGFTDTVRYPKHKYATAGTYTVKFAMISNVGCFSDTAVKQVTVTNVPVANFSLSSPVCEGLPVTFTNLSSASPPATLVKWFWNYGDGIKDTLLNGNSHTHTYSPWGNNTITLIVATNSGCQSLVKTLPLYVNPIPFANFTMPATVCLPFDSAHFLNTSTIADGTGATLGYLWNFGDIVNNTSTNINPVHYYNNAGPFNIKLTVTSAAGCVKDTTRSLATVYPRALSSFTVGSEYCLNNTSSFTSTSIGSGSTITNWYWDFGDATTGTGQNTTHTYLTTGIKTIKHWIKTDKGCYSDTVTHTITINPLPTANFTTNAPYCATRDVTFTDASVANAGNIILWNWDLGDGTLLALNSNVPFTHQYATAGNKNVTLKVTTDKGCVSTVINKVITINPLPVAKFTHLQACLPYQSVIFTNTTTVGNASTLSYTWNFGDPGSGAANTSTIPNPSHLYTGTGPYNVTLTATSSDGCIKDTVIAITDIYEQAHGAFTVNPENCLNDPTVFTSTSTGSGAAITNYFWDFGDASPISNAQNPSHTYATAGTQTIKHWIKTINGCTSDTVQHTVIINPLPTGNFNFNTPSCETRTISFTDASVANAGSLASWAWDFNDPSSGTSNTSTLQNPTHEFATSGIYNVKLTVTTNKGCVSSVFTRQVTINSRPQAGYIVPEVCLNDTYAQFTDTSHIASGSIVSWQWNFGDPLSTGANPNTSNLQNPTHSFTATGTYNAQLIVTSALGCKDTIVHTIIVSGSFPVANFTVSNAGSLCANDSVRITNTSNVFPGVITKVEIYWDNVGSPAVFETDNIPVSNGVYSHLYPNFQAPLTKNFTIRFRAYSGGVCVNDKYQTITVNAAPKVQFNSIPNTCLNVPPYQLTQATEVGAVPGTFVFTGPGVSSTGMFDPVSVGPGLYTIHYTYTSDKGCMDSATQQVRVLVAPVAKFGFGSPACENNTLLFSDSSTTTVGILTQWTWDFDDGSAPVVQNSPAPFTHIFISAGTFHVKLFVTTSDGCKSNITTKDVVVTPQPRPNFSFEDTTCLPNAIIHFNDLSTIANGTENQFTYLWNFGDPGSGLSNTSTAKNPSHQYIAVGPYNVKLQVTSGAFCVHDTTIVLNTIHPQPKADFDFNKPSVCIGDDVIFRDRSNGKDGSVTAWNWDFGDNEISGLQNPSHTYSTIGLYNVSFYSINSFGCNSDTVSKPYNVYPYPVVDAGPDKFVLEGGQTILQSTVSGNDLRFQWAPDLYLNNAQVQSPVCIPFQDITYTLSVTARGGCTASDKVFVKVLPTPVIPNTFTPNGDGRNNTWIIKYLDTYPNCRVQVFTREGQLVFESRGYREPWDGTLKGKPLPVDTYYYIIEPGSGRDPITGYVTIIK